MKKAYIREGVVQYVEDRDIPLEQLFHPDVCKDFVDIPLELQNRVCYGWRYDLETGDFTEPSIGSPIPNTNDIYTPNDPQALTALLVQTAQDVTQAQLDAIALQQQLTGLALNAMKGA